MNIYDKIGENELVAFSSESTKLGTKCAKSFIELITIENCMKIAAKLNFVIFDDKPNIWGVRVPKGSGFNDVFFIFHKEYITPVSMQPIWKSIITYGTTEPSATYLQTLMSQGGKNKNGIAILQADKQFIDCWTFGKHKGKYEALQQYWKFKFSCYRKKKDDILYYDGTIYDDAQGINFHTTRLGYYINKIVGFSEGCQVVFDATIYFDEIMPLLKRWEGKKYSYALVNDYQFLNLKE